MKPSGKTPTPEGADTTIFDDDVELTGSARAGDPAAVEQLAMRLARIPAMIRQRDRLLHTHFTPDDIEEIAQDTIMAIWAKLSTYEGHAPIEGWAHGFAVRQHMKAAEKRGKCRQTMSVVEVDPSQEYETVTLDDEYLALHESLSALRATQAFIVRERHFEERPFADIAEELGLPANTVKTKYYRGIAQLRERLASFWRGRQPGHGKDATDDREPR